jgi:hypothetical protein
MKLIIEGSEKVITTIERENKLRAQRYGLKMSIVTDDVKEDIEEDDETLTVADTIELIKLTDKIEDLKQFESDERIGVKKALAKRLSDFGK